MMYDFNSIIDVIFYFDNTVYLGLYPIIHGHNKLHKSRVRRLQRSPTCPPQIHIKVICDPLKRYKLCFLNMEFKSSSVSQSDWSNAVNKKPVFKNGCILSTL